MFRNVLIVCAAALTLPVLAATPTTAQQSRTQKSQAGPAAPAGANQALLPFKAVEKTLPNGLKVIVVPTGFPNLVSVQIPVKTGSRNEVEAGKTGFAHFFEHMMFRGTRNVTPDQYEAALKKAGARNNAYTTDDYTNYHTTFAKEDLETILKLEADRFQNLSYAEPEFRTEARAVLGEYNKNSAEPLNKLEEIQRDAAFTTHTYKHTTMGFLADIEAMPDQFGYSKVFFDRWYRPENTAVIVAGDVDPAKTFALVEKHWSGWKRGSFTAAIPSEPAPKGSVTAHLPWPTDTLPWVTVAFHGPAFSETRKDFVALDLLFDLTFGPTSPLYKKLVVDERKVDQLFPDVSVTEDPGLVGAYARVKKLEDVPYVRDEILKAFAAARAELVEASRVADAKAHGRYGLLRGLDSTDRIAGLLARFVRVRRSFDTLNRFYALYDTLTPQDLQNAARTFLTDAGLVQTTLSKEPPAKELDSVPSLASLEPKAPAVDLALTVQRSPLPQLTVKLLFLTGSADDPAGKEGLARLAASMTADAGSRDRTIDEIRKALFPIAGAFSAQVDREMTAFTLSIHRDNWRTFFDTVLPMLVSPGDRDEDLSRVRDQQRNALKQDLKSSNEEELGKEILQAAIFVGTPYGHTVLGTEKAVGALTVADVKAFRTARYTRANLRVGVGGDAPDEMLARLKRELATLPKGTAGSSRTVAGRMPKGIEVDVVKKETRAVAISLGHPLEVTRSHPDFVALYLARTWLGEHRSSASHLYQRIREIRGFNYGDYAYVEAFPRGMFQFFPDANLGRKAQVFEIWIRPVAPQNAHMALRIAIAELRKLVANGLTKEELESTRDYLAKNVFVMTATQNQQLGYALDSAWYGIPEYTRFMRDGLAKLTLEDVNRAIRRHLSGENLRVVVIAKDAEGFKEKLVADAPSPVTYDAPKPPALLDEDKVIGALKLGIAPEKVVITSAESVFAE